MARAPGNVKDFDGAGNVWFKVFEITANADPAGKNAPTYPATSELSLVFCPLIIVLYSHAQRHFHYTKEHPHRTVRIAHRIPSFEVNYSRYLVRIEHIALHVAQSYGGAQFYVACAQLDVTNGGNGTPGPRVSIPGVYNGNVCTNFLLVLVESKHMLARIEQFLQRNTRSLFTNPLPRFGDTGAAGKCN